MEAENADEEQGEEAEHGEGEMAEGEMEGVQMENAEMGKGCHVDEAQEAAQWPASIAFRGA
jgi:hypothetical protein